MYKILPSITTTVGSDWRMQIQELLALSIKEAALFITGLPKNQRPEMYKVLEDSGLKFPFVHLRADTDNQEIEYLMTRFKAQCFNLHSENKFALENDISKYKKKIYLETMPDETLTEEELQKYAGICLDISHLEEGIKHGNFGNMNLLRKFPIGCLHISAMLPSGEATHKYTKLSEFDYAKKYKVHRAPFMALELENSIAEQLKVKEYLESLWRF